MPLLVTHVRFSASSDVDRRLGLICWVSIVLNDALMLDGLAVRRTAAGELRVFFPERVDHAGRHHKIMWPLDAADRATIERQVLDALAAQQVTP